MRTKNIDYVTVLKRELKAVMGCTEPAAAALAGAMARELLGDTPDTIVVHASRDVIKNVMGVGIPNSSATGLAAAVLLGIYCGNSTYGLNILSKINEPNEKELFEYTHRKEISVSIAADVPSFYVQVLVKTSNNDASVTISGEHDRVVEKTKNGKVLYKRDEGKNEFGHLSSQQYNWDIQDIVSYIFTCRVEDISFLADMAQTNLHIAQHGLEHPYGLQVGRGMHRCSSNGTNSLEDAFDYAAMLAASASDARMAGCPYPVVINSGSGNQGITTMVPPLIIASYLKADRDRLVRALALSNLVAILLAQYKGRLSALCGAFTAAIGTCCAFVYLMGGSVHQIDNAIQIMIANLTGVVCDGAKKTCALKIHSCVQSAAMTARLVMQERTMYESVGIVGATSQESLKHLRILCHEGLEATDQTILSIMVGR
ncbi:MAG: serine dehydratase subunit alpha family protein [Spirochaetota bacterium]